MLRSVFADPHGRPNVAFLAAFDHDPHAGGRGGLGIDHADFIVDQVHFGQIGKRAVERLADRCVESVDRAVALGHLVADLVADAELDRRFGRRLAVARVLHVHVVVEQLEMGLEDAGALAHEQIEGPLGGFELVARMFLGDDLRKNLVHQHLVVLDLVLGRHGHDVGPSRQLADENPPLVADGLRGDVLVAGRVSSDGADMHPPLVREGAFAHERLMGWKVHVHHLVDVARQLGQVPHAVGQQQVVTVLLDRQVGKDADQVGIAAALSETVDRALHLGGAGVDRGE